MHGLVVTISVSGHQEEQTYDEWEVAACVFEANLQSLVSDGFAVVDNRCGPDALNGFASAEADELYTARRGAMGIESVSIDAADPAAIYDGTGARLHRARNVGRFDRSVVDPAWEIDHALRRVIHWPGAWDLQSFELAVGFEYPRFLAWVRADDARALLTHLHLLRTSSRPPCPELGGLGQTFPNLRALALPRQWLLRSGGAEFAELQYLQMEGVEGDLGDCLELASRRAPGLLALSVAVSGRELATVLGHPLISRLYEIHALVLGTFDATALVDDKSWHRLERLHIEARELDDSQRELLGRWPTVCLAEHRPTGACWQSLRRRYGP